MNVKKVLKDECFEKPKTTWLTRRQASEYLQCSLCSLDTRLKIKKYFLNKSVRYLKTDLDEYLFSHCKEVK